MSDDVKVWRYVLPNVRHEGWAIVLMDSTGYFSAVSDFGNYAFQWRAHGCADFRQFLLRADKDADYFINKLKHEDVFDEEDTRKSLKQLIAQERRRGRIDAAQAREEWDNAKSIDSEWDFHDFINNTSLENAHECHCRCPPGMVVGFVTKVMTRLIPLLKADLQADAKDNPAICEHRYEKAVTSHGITEMCVYCQTLVLPGIFQEG
jgi:hypothetical protein